jgi:putative tricarboxylic transport membrane protein
VEWAILLRIYEEMKRLNLDKALIFILESVENGVRYKLAFVALFKFAKIGRWMEKTQSHYNRIAAIFFLAVGIFFALYARAVEIGDWHEPGPGFLPFWAGNILSVMALALLVGSYGRKASPARPSFFPQTNSWKRVLATFLALIAYNLLLPYLGFTVTTFLFLTVLVKFIFPQTWMRTLLVSILGSVVARLLFINFLETQLPKGFLGF